MSGNFFIFNPLQKQKTKINKLKKNTKQENDFKNIDPRIFCFENSIDLKQTDLIGRKDALDFQCVFEKKPTFTSPFDIERTTPTRQAEKTCNIKDVAKSMIKIIDAKDNYTAQHSNAVRDYAQKFASSLGLSKNKIEDISIGAVFHDIGKIGIADSILKSKLPLDFNEFEEIKKHTQIGYEILQDMPNFKGIVSKIVKHHHEHWDGSGYPEGLKGENIPFEARLVAIVDSYHAMTSNRPYRKGLSEQEAFKRLKQGSGKQWDPYLIKEFSKIIDLI